MVLTFQMKAKKASCDPLGKKYGLRLNRCWHFCFMLKRAGRRQWHPTPVPFSLPGKSHGRRSLEGCSPWGHWRSDMTEQLHFHFSLSCIEKEMATHSSVLAWRITGMGEPGGLPSVGSHRARHDWSDLAAAAKRAVCWKPETLLCQQRSE